MSGLGAPAGPPTIGVIGTMVWDTIRPVGDGKLVEDWGGIAYSLAALDASLQRGWKALPFVKIGEDLAASAVDFLKALPRVRTDAILSVPEPNNRVELRYQNDHERVETLSGGVPAWSIAELLPDALDCDALYINFVSGFEMSLSTAQDLRRAFTGPIYVDLHSLFLGIDETGQRYAECPAEIDAWFNLFDFVQLNRLEAELLTEAGVQLNTPGPAGVVVTDGPRGAHYEATPALLRSPPEWPEPSQPVERTGRGKVSADPRARTVDATGCGDVWGAACFAGLLGGDGLRQAAEQASRTAEAALGIRGTNGLHTALGSGSLARHSLAARDRKSEAAS